MSSQPPLLESTGDRFERSGSVANAKRLVYLKLMEEAPKIPTRFKFIIYSGKIGEHTAADDCDQVEECGPRFVAHGGEVGVPAADLRGRGDGQLGTKCLRIGPDPVTHPEKRR